MPDREPLKTVSVQAGPYATVRAIHEAEKVYGPGFTVAGVIAESNGGRRYCYEVVEKRDSRIVQDA